MKNMKRNWAGKEDHENNTTARTDADKDWLPEVFGIRGRIQLGLEYLQYGLTDLLTDASRPTTLADAACIGAPRPVLIIAAGDVENEVYSAAHIQQQAPSSVTVWVVPGAGHTQGLSVAPTEWEHTVISFLDASLSRS
jgi:uncharacterized protein